MPAGLSLGLQSDPLTLRKLGKIGFHFGLLAAVLSKKLE